MKNCLILISLVIAISFTPSLCDQHKRKENAITFNAYKGTLPNQILKCMEDYSLLRCMKYFILVKIESQAFQKSGNLSKDFLEQILQKEKELPPQIPHRLLILSETELNKRLTVGLQRYFKDRSITLHFIPNMLVKVVPSKDNSLEFSLKKSDKYFTKGRSDTGSDQSVDNKGGNNGIGGLGGKGGKSQYNHYLQLGKTFII